jgi:two-component system, OmpR family, sensor histidine kinase BaeS
MRSLRSQLALSHILPILLLVPIMSLLLLRTLEDFNSRSLLRQLDYQARVLHGWLERDRGLTATEDHADQFVAQLAGLTQARIVILSSDAVILASTEPEDAARVGTRYSDAGVEQALNGAVARGIGPGITAEVAYVVMPLRLGDASTGALRLSYEVADSRAHFERLRGLILAGAGMTILVGLALGAGLSATITRPLSALFRSVSAVSIGDYQVRVPTEGPTEITTLAESFNHMNERLEEAERTRSQQLSAVIHELARPVTGIRAALETLQDGADQDPGFRKSLLDGSVEEIGRLERLIDTLRGLRNRKLEPLSISRGDVELNVIIEGCLGSFLSRAAQNDVSLRAQLGEAMRVYGDSDRLIQVLSNLIDNALKFAPRGGTVTVSARRSQQMVWVEVADTGPGIPKADLPHIFQQFYRGETSADADQRGMGLGLPICKEIISAHGGQIWAANRAGGGAVVTFTLPPA